MAVSRAAALVLLLAWAWSGAAAQGARPAAGSGQGAGAPGRPPAPIVFPPAGLKGPASIARPDALNAAGGPLSVRVEPRQPLGRATAALRGVASRLQRLVGAADGAGNLLMSPLSVAAALGQLLLGARGETRALLADLLDAPGPTRTVPKVSLGGEVLIPDLEYHQQFKALLDLLAADDAPASSVELRIASAFFAQRGLPLRTDFQHALHDLYQADVRSLDFRDRPAEAASLVNEWARRATRGRIPTVLAQPLPPSTAALVASAVYFRGAWAWPFDPELTVNGWFRLDAKRRVAAKFMRSHFTEVPYYDAPGLGYRLVVLPYKGGQTAMYVMLPDDKDVDLRTFASSMSLDGMMAAARAARPQTLTLILPRMNIAGSFSLKEPLSNLRRTRRLRRARRSSPAAAQPPSPPAQVSAAAGPRQPSTPTRDDNPSPALLGLRQPSHTAPNPSPSSQTLPGPRQPSTPTRDPSPALLGLRQPSNTPPNPSPSSQTLAGPCQPSTRTRDNNPSPALPGLRQPSHPPPNPSPPRQPSQILSNPSPSSQALPAQREPSQASPEQHAPSHALPDRSVPSRTGTKSQVSSQSLPSPLPSAEALRGERASSVAEVPLRARQPAQFLLKHLAAPQSLPELPAQASKEPYTPLKSLPGHQQSSQALSEPHSPLDVIAALYEPSRSAPNPSVPSQALPITRVSSQFLHGYRAPSRIIPAPGAPSQPLSVSPDPSQPFQVSLPLSGHESGEQNPVEGIVLEEHSPIPVAKTSLNRPVVVGVPLRIVDADDSHDSSKRQSNLYYQAKASPSDTLASDSYQESHLLYPYRPTSTSVRKSSNEKPPKIMLNAKDSQEAPVPKMVLGTQVNFPYDASLLSAGVLKDPILPSVSNLRKIRPALDANDRGNCTATADVSVSDSASPGAPTKLFANIFIKPPASVHTGPVKGREEEQESTNHILIARSEQRARAVDSPATPFTFSAESSNTTPSTDLAPPSSFTGSAPSAGPVPFMHSSGTSEVSQPDSPPPPPSSPLGQPPSYVPAGGQSPSFNTPNGPSVSPPAPLPPYVPSADQARPPSPPLPSRTTTLPPYVSPIVQPSSSPAPASEATAAGGESQAPGVQMQMSEGDGATLNPLAVGSQGAFGVRPRPTAPGAFADVDLDLTGASNQTLRVSDALHHVWLEVTETGTEAVAITTTLVDYSGAEQLVAVNRPFLLAIVHEPSGALLFWAAVNDPTGGAGIRTDAPQAAGARFAR